MACRLATCPTKRSPDFVNPTTDGVVIPPSSLGMTFGSPPSITATTEFVVPKSIPIILPIKVQPPCNKCRVVNQITYNSNYIIRVESLIVKVLDVPNMIRDAPILECAQTCCLLITGCHWRRWSQTSIARHFSHSWSFFL